MARRGPIPHRIYHLTNGRKVVKAEVDKNYQAEYLGLITALDDVETERPVSRKQTLKAQRFLPKDGLQWVRSYPSVIYAERPDHSVFSRSGHAMLMGRKRLVADIKLDSRQRRFFSLTAL